MQERTSVSCFQCYLRYQNFRNGNGSIHLRENNDFVNKILKRNGKQTKQTKVKLKKERKTTKTEF